MSPKDELLAKPFRYKLYVTKIIDGDTIEATIDMGMGIWQVDQTCRLNGIHAPAITPGVEEALLARAYLRDAVWIMGLADERSSILGKYFIAETHKPESRKIQPKYEKGIFVNWLVDLYGCTDVTVVHLNKHLLNLPVGSVFNEYQ
jgi:hypothetical protein